MSTVLPDLTCSCENNFYIAQTDTGKDTVVRHVCHVKYSVLDVTKKKFQICSVNCMVDMSC